MEPIDLAVADFIDALSRDLAALFTRNGAAKTIVSRNREPRESANSDFAWWSCPLSIDQAFSVYLGALPELWKEMDEGASNSPVEEQPLQAWFTGLADSIQKIAGIRFGSKVICTNAGWSEKPPDGWPTAGLEIAREGRGSRTMSIAVSPELAIALRKRQESARIGEARPDQHFGNDSEAGPRNVLLEVEMPVSVSFGYTRMRMKDVLSLTTGSIVTLDRELGDQVEVRVNNCVIALGEVVAVDGNYGVRIQTVVAARAGPGVRGALSERGLI